MPLPHLSGKRGLDVDFYLLDVERFGIKLQRRSQQPRVTYQFCIERIAQVQSHRGAHLTGFLFNDVGRVNVGKECRQAPAQKIDLV